jgi:hypothetical protein
MLRRYLFVLGAAVDRSAASSGPYWSIACGLSLWPWPRQSIAIDLKPGIVFSRVSPRRARPQQLESPIQPCSSTIASPVPSVT